MNELLRIDLANGAVQSAQVIAVRGAISAVALERLPSGRFAVALQPHGGPDAPPLSMTTVDPATGTLQGLFEPLLVPHGMHVALGVLWLLSWWIYSFFGDMRGKATDIEVTGLYWHFVDIVWIVIFTVIYLVEFVGVGAAK